MRSGPRGRRSLCHRPQAVRAPRLAGDRGRAARAGHAHQWRGGARVPDAAGRPRRRADGRRRVVRGRHRGPAARARPAPRPDAARARRALHASARRARRPGGQGADAGQSPVRSREVLQWQVRRAGDGWRVEVTIDGAAREHLETRGISASASSRPAATRGRRREEYLEAYRGQARVERAFRGISRTRGWARFAREYTGPITNWSSTRCWRWSPCSSAACSCGGRTPPDFRGVSGPYSPDSRRSGGQRWPRCVPGPAAGISEQLEDGDDDLHRLAAALKVGPAPPTGVAYTRRRR